MGLQFSHSDARWCYSGFQTFREQIHNIYLYQHIPFNIKHGLALLLMCNDGDTKFDSEYSSIIYIALNYLLDNYGDRFSEDDFKQATLFLNGLKEASLKNEYFLFQ